MTEPPLDLEESVARMRTLARMFAELAETGRLGEVIDLMRSGDRKGFQEFLSPYREIPCHQLCLFVRDSMRQSIEVERCAVKLGLSGTEWVEFLRIFEKHHGPIRPVVSMPGLQPMFRDVIEPGPYLDDLKAAGLVDCWRVNDFVEIPGLKPERVCIDLCAP